MGPRGSGYGPRGGNGKNKVFAGHTMQAHGESRRSAPHILNLSTRPRWVINSRPATLLPIEKSRDPPNRKLGGPRACPCVLEKLKMFPEPAFCLFSVLHLYYFFVLIVPFFLTVQHSQRTNIYAPGGIRTRNLSMRSAADPRLKTARRLGSASNPGPSSP